MRDEKRQSEDNAEGDGDSRSGESESWDGGTWKSRIHHFGVSIRVRE